MILNEIRKKNLTFFNIKQKVKIGSKSCLKSYYIFFKKSPKKPKIINKIID